MKIKGGPHTDDIGILGQSLASTKVLTDTSHVFLSLPPIMLALYYDSGLVPIPNPGSVKVRAVAGLPRQNSWT